MFTKQRIIILAVLVVSGFILGRLAWRGLLNLVLGGTMFGGDFL